jgi:phosphatidate phosphatase APP1
LSARGEAGICGLGLFLLLLYPFVGSPAQVSRLKSDQDLVLYPTFAYPVDKGQWEVQIHGCIFEPDPRDIALFLLRTALALDHIHLTKAQNIMFTERVRLFMVDHKGGNKIYVRIGGRVFKAGKSEPNGHFSNTLRFSDSEIKKIRDAGDFVQLVLSPKDRRTIRGELYFFDDSGTMVISDIDDTIKITQVTDSHSVLRNTFLEPFRAVPGMPELYRGWAKTNHAEFCYVSASPWQLFSPLDAFIHSNSFPVGPFFLKKFRLKDETFLSVFQSPEQYKPGVIEPLLKQFPHRKFVLVGDSGEKDPEIYAALARKFPGQITRIFIRDLDDGTDHSQRYKTVFDGISEDVWKTFREPSEIANLLPQ